VLGFALTDEAGHFRFNHLPLGTYQVMADLPRYGRGMCEEITLSVEQPAVSGLHLFVNQEGRVNMRYEGPVSEKIALCLYPNPTEKELFVGGLKENEMYQVAISNGLGVCVMPEVKVKTNLLGEFDIKVDELQAGVYFIQVKGASESVVAKFVKQ
jgi:hypothetical protein